MRTMRFAAVIVAGAFLFYGAPAHAVVPTQDEPIAVLRALDKITARVEELNVPTGDPYKFGTLIITVRACRLTLPEETPEAAAFLEISELKPGEQDTPIFHGWMFASSPALSAMQHPVYDIWVTGCKGTPGQNTTGPTPAATEAAPAEGSTPQPAPQPAAPAVIKKTTSSATH